MTAPVAILLLIALSVLMIFQVKYCIKCIKVTIEAFKELQKLKDKFK